LAVGIKILKATDQLCKLAVQELFLSRLGYKRPILEVDPRIG